MIHKMQLNKKPFDLIKNGNKTIELRLLDEKRKNIKIGDEIMFSLKSENETIVNDFIIVRVIALHKFKNFIELYSVLPLNKCGYTDIEVASPSDMDEYYSREKQLQYGVVGIEFEVCSINIKY